jgi:hypothetical protein
MHSFLGYVAEHPNATFYAEWLFSNTANLMSGFRYNISQLPCSLSTRISAQSDAYIVLGGTISMDIDPSALSNYAACVSANLTNSQPAYVAQNPYQPASPLRIIKVG